jgi:translation initiation factor eIF-2B subunit gamma
MEAEGSVACGTCFFQIKQEWDSVTAGCELTPIHRTSEIKSTQIDDSCIVGEQTSIAEKTSIKNCNIGAHCQIEPKVRLTQCILMNGVKIREG